MHRLVAATLAATFLFLPAAPAHAGAEAGRQGTRGPDVQVTASPDCSTEPLTVILFVRNTGSDTLHIVGSVDIVVREPRRHPYLFFGTPAPGFDVIEPGGQLRFVVPIDDVPPRTFEAERIVFGVEFHFAEKRNPVIRHTVFPGCS